MLKELRKIMQELNENISKQVKITNSQGNFVLVMK